MAVSRRRFLGLAAGAIIGAGCTLGNLARNGAPRDNFVETRSNDEAAPASTRLVRFAFPDNISADPVREPALRPWRDSVGWGYRVSSDKSYARMVDDFQLLRRLG